MPLPATLLRCPKGAVSPALILDRPRLLEVSPKREPSRACRVGDEEDAQGGRDSGDQFPAGSWASV
jgi:hypothetical protein